MALSSFPTNAPVQIQLDWIELKCLSDSFDCVIIEDIKSFIELQSDYQDEDISVEDERTESVIDTILKELESRQKSLNSSYPFQIESGGNVISLTSPLEDMSVDQHVYLYCLIFSHVTNSPILTLKDAPTNAERDILQICSTIAAAGYVRGHSISFGFPRQDKTPYYAKAKRVLELLKEGRLRKEEEVNPLHSLSPKDAGIDIISWEESNDHMPGKKVYFSQVASGHNWKDKPVLHYIEIFKTYWLDQPILSRINDAMFIPFDMIDDVDNRYTAQQFIESELSKLGTIFYRRRIPAWFREGINFHQTKQGLVVERVNECQKITDYVGVKITELRAASVT